MLHEANEFIAPIESLLGINLDVIKKNADKVYTTKLHQCVLQAGKRINIERRAESFTKAVQSRDTELKDITMSSLESSRSSLNITIAGIVEESERLGNKIVDMYTL
jgi:hypothetical protein